MPFMIYSHNEIDTTYSVNQLNSIYIRNKAIIPYIEYTLKTTPILSKIINFNYENDMICI